ncbi:hypothetical protein A9Z42_0036780 [Trichoderma parareesei]|uniref:Azaphilone pigments biosynthesis cluster protein L N-terminal domain-containing protein n=1 Tax=Trichoderma parareesei TaxID=858221 RepID=A0A2H2ZR95_TRIPA|nr:hypothetical protein A9Z42_0036780 [Trichoderma parareesei]
MNSISSSSGVLSLLKAAIDSSRTLQKTTHCVLNNERAIRDLNSEIESLIQILESLKSVATDEGPVISLVKLPLLCCHQICQEFNAVILRCPEASTGDPKTCLRDWTQIKYMGGDIRDFGDVLVGYKSTIAITLERLKMQNAPVTHEARDQYKVRIQEATTDLKAHLKVIDQKLAITAQASRQGPDSAANEVIERLRRERQSAQQCLRICEDATSFLHTLPNSQPEQDSPTETATTITDARDKVAHMLAELQKQLLALTERSLAINDTPDQPKQQQQQQYLEEGRLRLLQQIEMAEQCLEACNLAVAQASRQRVHVLDNVVAEDNSHQVIVFPPGDILHVKNIRAGKSSTQWLGCISDGSLQQLSADRAASFTSLPSSPSSSTPSPAKETDPSFGNKYGLGYKLREGETVGIQSMSGGSSSQRR